jgi:hypothetical protein
VLDLAERQRIGLGRISIRALAEQFVAELDGRLRAARLDGMAFLRQAAAWLQAAAAGRDVFAQGRPGRDPRAAPTWRLAHVNLSGATLQYVASGMCGHRVIAARA